MAYVEMIIEGGRKTTLSFARVPVVGEIVNFERANYRVTVVQHTPTPGPSEGSMLHPLAVIVVTPES